MRKEQKTTERSLKGKTQTKHRAETPELQSFKLEVNPSPNGNKKQGTSKNSNLSPATVWEFNKTKIELYQFNSMMISENQGQGRRKQISFVHTNFYSEVMNIDSLHVGTCYFRAEGDKINTDLNQIRTIEEVLSRLYAIYLTMERPKNKDMPKLPEVIYFERSKYPNVDIDKFTQKLDTIYLIFDQHEKELRCNMNGNNSGPFKTSKSIPKFIKTGNLYKEHEFVLLFVALLRVTDYKTYEKILKNPRGVLKNADAFRKEYENIRRLGLDMEFRYCDFLDLECQFQSDSN